MNLEINFWLNSPFILYSAPFVHCFTLVGVLGPYSKFETVCSIKKLQKLGRSPTLEIPIMMYCEIVIGPDHIYFINGYNALICI